MTKLRWNGTDPKQDPDEIVHYGVTLPRGVWVDVPKDSKNPNHRKAVQKAIGNPQLEVEGYEGEYEDDYDPGADPKVQKAAQALRLKELKDEQKAAQDAGNAQLEAERKDAEAKLKAKVGLRS